jgi:chromosomal replication initiation ATPase DnaA
MTTDTQLRKYKNALAMEIRATAKEIGKVTEIPWEMILNRRRFEDVATARMILWCVMRNRGYGYSRIGKAAGRDHCTIMHANRVIPQRYGRRGYSALTRWIDELENVHGFTVIAEKGGK